MKINHPVRAGLTSTLVGIGQGEAGIRDTTKIMAQMVQTWADDPYINAEAISITQLTQPKDEPSEVRALFDFVQKSVRYVKDVAGKETLRTPDKTLLLMAGDCDDKAVLLASLLRSIGYSAFFIITGYTTPGVFEHVYVGVPLPDGTYLALDPTEEQPMGWEASNPVAYYIEQIPE